MRAAPPAPAPPARPLGSNRMDVSLAQKAKGGVVPGATGKPTTLTLTLTLTLTVTAHRSPLTSHLSPSP